MLIFAAPSNDDAKEAAILQTGERCVARTTASGALAVND
jgi:hypothetical protein